MSYSLNFVANFPATVTPNAKLYNAAGSLQSTITTGFVDLGNNRWSYLATLSDGFQGALVIYDSADEAAGTAFSINPSENDGATRQALDTVDTVVDSILDDTGTAGVVLSTSQMQALADVILGRSVATVEGSASTHSLAEIILALLESATSGTTWTIKKTDGSTTFNTRTLTLDSAADPVVGVT